ncbi:hypothetical protein F5146DRAFT_1193647 [Armillaria mellea]|nr:hypothetical protein F5146DRAFT_1193647 [Armillaria mellea]
MATSQAPLPLPAFLDIPSIRMLADDLENGFRGMISLSKLADMVTENHDKGQPEAQKNSDLETPPKSPEAEAKDFRRRLIVRGWPRDPKGPIMKATPPGKVAGNNQPLRIPDCENLSTISTGSKLCAWMKEIGELEHAKDQIAWAEDEPDPEELFPYDMAVLLRDDDLRAPDDQRSIDEQFKTVGDHISILAVNSGHS